MNSWIYVQIEQWRSKIHLEHEFLPNEAKVKKKWMVKVKKKKNRSEKHAFLFWNFCSKIVRMTSLDLFIVQQIVGSSVPSVLPFFIAAEIAPQCSRSAIAAFAMAAGGVTLTCVSNFRLSCLGWIHWFLQHLSNYGCAQRFLYDLSLLYDDRNEREIVGGNLWTAQNCNSYENHCNCSFSWKSKRWS